LRKQDGLEATNVKTKLRINSERLIDCHLTMFRRHDIALAAQTTSKYIEEIGSGIGSPLKTVK
jgi:hypothetical protein